MLMKQAPSSHRHKDVEKKKVGLGLKKSLISGKVNGDCNLFSQKVRKAARASSKLDQSCVMWLQL